MPPLVYALLLHGALGFIDVLVNHELLAKLPARREAAEEEALHAAREGIMACLFASLAWYEWHGALVWWIAALLLAEVLVAARDVVVEGNVRVLPVSERVLHLLLFMNLGALVTLAACAFVWRQGGEATLVRVDYGWASWVLSAMALGALGWAARDGLAALKWKAQARRA